LRRQDKRYGIDLLERGHDIYDKGYRLGRNRRSQGNRIAAPTDREALFPFSMAVATAAVFDALHRRHKAT
jgi:hypothetical protein